MKNFYKGKRDGFTLFELLVVISIIGLIVAVGMVSYSQAQKRGRDARRKEDLKAWQKGLEQYYAENTAYIVGCDPGSDFMPGGVPADPKPGFNYAPSCTATSYCICAGLEISGIGNATNTSCNYASGDYFCVSNLQ